MLLSKYKKRYITSKENTLQKLLEKFPEEAWSWKILSGNPNITFELIEKFPDKDWNFFLVFQDEKYDMEEFDTVKSLFKEPCSFSLDRIANYIINANHWKWFSQNPKVTMETIEKFPDKPWNWRCVSMNPNLTVDFVQKHIDKPWDWALLSTNKFLFDATVFHREIGKDIKSKRAEVTSLRLYGDLDKILGLYMGYR